MTLKIIFVFGVIFIIVINMNGYIQNTTFMNDLTAEKLAASDILLLLSNVCPVPDIPPLVESFNTSILAFPLIGIYATGMLFCMGVDKKY
jgi:hypothetical protein